MLHPSFAYRRQAAGTAGNRQTLRIYLLCAASLWLLSATTACSDDILANNQEATCADKRYHDGTCHYDLQCSGPDIDCFAMFDSPAAANAVLDRFEMGELSVMLPNEHPNWLRAHSIFDRAWEIWRAYSPFPLFELANVKPTVVVLNAQDRNAFTTSTSDGTSAYVVWIYNGLLRESDDVILSVYLHELSHVMRLHPALQGYRRPYVSPTETEPFGFEAAHLPAAPASLQALDLMINLREQVGTEYTDPELDSLVVDFFNLAILQFERTPDCKSKFESYLFPVSNIIDATQFGRAYTSADIANAKTAMTAFLPCLPPGFSAKVRAQRAEAGARERAAAAIIQSDIGQLRNYTKEEQADDDASALGRLAGLTGTELGQFFVGDRSAECLEGRSVPRYGLLSEPHHSACYRWYHFEQLTTREVLPLRPFEVRLEEVRPPTQLSARATTPAPPDSTGINPYQSRRHGLIRLGQRSSETGCTPAATCGPRGSGTVQP